MKTSFIAIFILFSIVTFSQKNDFKVLSRETVVGKNYLNDSDIKGVEYLFPSRIYRTNLDSASGYLTVQLRRMSNNGKLKSKGFILLYDLNKKKQKWSKKINYLTSSLLQYGNTMVLTVDKKSYCLDINTGNELWEVKDNIYYVDPAYNIGIGYRHRNSAVFTNELEGIDLKNGVIIWKKELNREYGWNDIFHMNDSTLIVVAAGLHSINIKNGTGWDYNTITGKKDYTGTVATNVAGAALGILTGTYVISTGHNLVRDVVSNVIVDSLYLYFSSAEQLAKIDKETGKIIWSHPFHKKFASKSTIFIDDSLVFMINKGYAYLGRRQLNFGKPFIAAFEKETGKQKYLSTINDKDDPILGYKIKDEGIYMVFKNKIAIYSQETGNLLKEKIFPGEKYGDLRYFIGPQAFITNEKEQFISLPQSDTTKIYVFTTKGNAMTIDSSLNITGKRNYKDLSVYYLKTDKYKFIAKDKSTWIIDDEGLKIAEINMALNAFLIGKTLYEKQDNSFLTVDLSGILKDE